MTAGIGGFSPSYERWLEAQEAVTDFERVIFRDGHHLTERELSRLQDLRRSAAACLRTVIDVIDDECGRLHLGPDGPAAENPLG